MSIPLPGFLPAWLTWKVLGYLAVALLAAGIVLKFKHQWIEQGKETTRQQVTEATAGNVIADAQTVAQGSQTRQQAAQANAGQATISKAQADALVGQVSALRQEIAQNRARVQQMPQESIRAYVVGELNLRQKGDVTPGYTEPEEREIAVRVTAYPKQQETIEKDAAAIAKLNQTIGKKEAEALLLAEDAKDWKNAHGRLLKDYTLLYNTYPHKHRSIKCLGLWKCVDKKLTVPAPSEISR